MRSLSYSFQHGRLLKVAALRTQNAEAGLNRDNFYAVQRDELQDTDDELNGETFDLVFCAHAFHHVKDVKQLTLALSRRIKKGGMLVVIDHQMDRPITSEEIDRVVAHKHGQRRPMRTDLPPCLANDGLLRFYRLQAAGVEGPTEREWSVGIGQSRGQSCSMAPNVYSGLNTQF